MLKLEADVDRSSDKFDFHALSRYDGKTFATKFHFRTSDKIYTSLEVKTPFRGYRKMNFVASYEKKDKITVTISASKPIKTKLELVLGNDSAGHIASINIVTPVKGYENVAIEVNIPMNKIAPKLLVKVLEKEYKFAFALDGDKYSKEAKFDINFAGDHLIAGSRLRYQAPYELSYFYELGDMGENFHFMCDSSFFEFMLLGY